jgi:hypothetical protein
MKQFGGELKPEQLQFLIKYEELVNKAGNNKNQLNQLKAIKEEFERVLEINAQREAQNIRNKKNDAEKKNIINKLKKKYTNNRSELNHIRTIERLAEIKFLIEEIMQQNINNTTKKIKISILGSMIKKYDAILKKYDEFKNINAQYKELSKKNDTK